MLLRIMHPSMFQDGQSMDKIRETGHEERYPLSLTLSLKNFASQIVEKSSGLSLTSPSEVYILRGR